MKAIHIIFDEQLLETLDRDEEVRRHGRSAVIRRAVAGYLRKKRRDAIAETYQRGYSEHPADSDLGSWTDRATWPDE